MSPEQQQLDQINSFAFEASRKLRVKHCKPLTDTQPIFLIHLKHNLHNYKAENTNYNAYLTFCVIMSSFRVYTSCFLFAYLLQKLQTARDFVLHIKSVCSLLEGSAISLKESQFSVTREKKLNDSSDLCLSVVFPLTSAWISPGKLTWWANNQQWFN